MPTQRGGLMWLRETPPARPREQSISVPELRPAPDSAPQQLALRA